MKNIAQYYAIVGQFSALNVNSSIIYIKKKKTN